MLQLAAEIAAWLLVRAGKKSRSGRSGSDAGKRARVDAGGRMKKGGGKKTGGRTVASSL